MVKQYNLFLIAIIFFIVVNTSIFIIACDNRNSSDDNGDSILVDEKFPEIVWTDTTSDLMWQTESKSGSLDWESAIEHCDSLVYADYDDWRLPTISELRSLVRGCPVTQTGGECSVTDSCVILSECWDAYDCGDCEKFEGPGKEGCYWPMEIKGRINSDHSCYCFFWSSTENPEFSYASYGYKAWGISFYDASLSSILRDVEFGHALCVM